MILSERDDVFQRAQTPLAGSFGDDDTTSEI